MSSIFVETFPDGEVREIVASEIEGWAETSNPDQSGVKLVSGEVVIVLHSPRDLTAMYEAATTPPLPPLPKLEPDRVLMLAREFYNDFGGARGDIVSNQVKALAHALCSEVNRVLAEALEEPS